MKTKLIITDIDGVWTDGGMYITEKGDEFKKFNTSDSLGIIIAKEFKILTCIITGEKTKLLQKRAEKLGVDYVFQGVKNKIKIAEKLINDLNISFDNVAYIGDDIGDINLLKKVSISACPNQAPDFIKNMVTFISKKNGGDGAFRDFVIKVMELNHINMSQILKQLNNENN